MSRYNLSDFDELLQSEPPASAPAGRPFVLPKQVHNGKRNDTLFKFARSLRKSRHQMSSDAVLAATQAENVVRCMPPLEAREVEDLVRNAMRLNDRPLVHPDEPREPRPAPADEPPASEPAAAASAEETEPPAAATTPSEPLAALLDDVAAFLTTFMVLQPAQTTVLSVWVLTTYLMPVLQFALYVHITSPLAECGKSRLLEVLSLLVHAPWLTARTSTAALVRKLDAVHPTLLLDETDAAFGGDRDYAETLRGVLNGGFDKELSKYSVCVGQGTQLEVKDFDVFGCKALAGIGRLPPTVESRSVTIALQRKTEAEPTSKLRKREAALTATPIRRRLVEQTTAIRVQVRDARPVMPDGLSDRSEDVLEALVAIGDLAGDAWSARFRAAAVQLMGRAAKVAQATEQEMGLRLLADVRDVFTTRGVTVIASAQLVSALVKRQESPWGAVGRAQKPLTQSQLARRLLAFKVVPEDVHLEVDGVRKTKRGYHRGAALASAFARYLVPECARPAGPNETGPESPKTEVRHSENGAPSKNDISPITTGVGVAGALSKSQGAPAGTNGGDPHPVPVPLSEEVTDDVTTDDRPEPVRTH